MKAVIALILLLVPVCYAIPSPTGYVTDYANILDSATNAQITDYITNLERNTTAEIAVLIVNNVEGAESEKTYAVQVFDEWNIGKEGSDNGVLLLVVMDTRRIEIEVGYGLEGVLPDGKVGDIIRANTQYFRDQQYGEGIYSIVRALGSEIQGEPFQKENNSSFIFIIIVFLFFILLLAVAVGKFYNKCPKCGAQLQTKDDKDRNFVIQTCTKCGFKRKKKKSGFMFVPIFVGGGHGGGGFGGFGGGGSGGGGAGGGW